MLRKILAVILIFLGLLGLILPIVPGLLLITIGALLFYKDRLAKIREKLPEEMPEPVCAAYDWFAKKAFTKHYEMLSDDVRLPEGGRLLDIGCGPGLLTAMIAEKFPASEITGIDLSSKMIELAKKNKLRATKRENLRFVRMDAKSLDFPNGSFDIIISAGALHAWKDPVRVLNEIHRCLKAPGRAFLYDGCAGVMKKDVDSSMKRFLGIFPPVVLVRYILNIHGYTREEYDTLVKAQISKSAFGACAFEMRGMMMRMELNKIV